MGDSLEEEARRRIVELMRRGYEICPTRSDLFYYECSCGWESGPDNFRADFGVGYGSVIGPSFSSDHSHRGHIRIAYKIAVLDERVHGTVLTRTVDRQKIIMARWRVE